MAESSSTLETRLTRAWLGRGPLACALWPLSLAFGALSGLRKALFRAGLLNSTRLPVPVVVVGNIFIGGTGKTPLTIWLVHTLQQAGFRPGVISRGFGSKDGAPREVTAASTPQQVGDEPVLIAARAGCPVVVGRDRAAAGLALLAAHPEVDILITDDGLQHYKLQRDVEIVLFDSRGVGNGWLLPAGPLREKPSRRRDVTVVNAPELTPALVAAVAPAGAPAGAPAVLPGSPDAVAASRARAGGGAALPPVPPVRMVLEGVVAERLADRGERVPLAALAQGPLKLAAAAGIGNPARFFGMLKAAGLRIAELPLPDHHDFLDRPFAGVDADLILMTEKDAVKCAQIEELRDDPRLWVVPVTARIDGALAEYIVEKCRGCSTA